MLAYAAALLTTSGWPLWSAFLLAIALSLVIGWVLGYPALRVQHHYLAFVTLAFATLVFLVYAALVSLAFWMLPVFW